MIFLDVKQYCQDNCWMFEAEVDKVSQLTKKNDELFNHDCIVRCKHRDICERMREKFSHPNEEDLK